MKSSTGPENTMANHLGFSCTISVSDLEREEIRIAENSTPSYHWNFLLLITVLLSCTIVDFIPFIDSEGKHVQYFEYLCCIPRYLDFFSEYSCNNS